MQQLILTMDIEDRSGGVDRTPFIGQVDQPQGVTPKSLTPVDSAEIQGQADVVTSIGTVVG